ncbi:MAG: hypothetical protein ABI690_02245 [Chloroflexota bacterium]
MAFIGRERIPTTLLFALLSATYLIFHPIVEFAAHNPVDYGNHLSYLKPDMDWPAVQRLLGMFPHFLFHLLTYLTFKVFPGATIEDAGARVAVAFYLLLGAAIFWLMVRHLGRPKNVWEGAIHVLVTVGLMLVMPVDIFTPTNLYLGYIATNVYHSPTMVVLKPFAVVVFYFAVQIFIKPALSKSPTSHKQRMGLVMLATVFCTLAKPNYVMALLPALILMTIYAYFRSHTIRWALLIAIIFSAGFILFCQAVIFGNTQGFLIAPLAVLNSWASINPDAPKGLILKFLLSILFPLVVYIGYFRQARHDIYLNLAWITFGFGAAYFYLLAESGSRLDDGNFTWSAQIALLILFIASTIFFVQQVRLRKFSLMAVVCVVACGLHLVSGIYWYHIHIVAASMGDIINSKW